MGHHIIWIFLIWVAVSGIGFISMPVSSYLFKKSSDGGHAFSKIFGLFAVCYIYFALATIKIISLSLLSLWFVMVLWAGINAFIYFKKKLSLKKMFSFRQVAITEIIFLVAFSGLLLVKSYHPEIYQIERFMDFGFIETLRNSVSLPAQDMWFAGDPINYYYFGHFIGFVVLTLTNISTVPGFFLLGAMIFGLLASAIYRLGVDFTALLLKDKKITRLSRFTSGILSTLGVLVLGTWYMVPWLGKKLSAIFGFGTEPSFFYPEPTRVMAGTITEMPIYSFIVADIHAHVWGVLSGVILMALLYSFWRSEDCKLSIKNYYLWATVFILGVSFMVNSWDAVTLGALALVVINLKLIKENKIFLIISSALIAGMSYLISLPWSYFYEPPVSGIGYVMEKSEFWPWISFWGPVFLIVVVYAIFSIYAFVCRKRKMMQDGLVTAIMFTGVFFVLVLELVYMKDIMFEGEWFRVNTVFKVTTQVWVWISIFLGPVFVWLLTLLKSRLSKTILILGMSAYVLIGIIYPVIAVSQAYTGNREPIGVDHGLDWWKRNFPKDFRAYLFLSELKSEMPNGEKMKRIVEAEGDSYTDVSRFSVFLGWPTIVGWAVHEWTWHGDYGPISARRSEVREIYVGTDAGKTRLILEKYDIDYIIVGEVEEETYRGQINREKLKDMGSVIYDNGGAMVIGVE